MTLPKATLRRVGMELAWWACATAAALALWQAFGCTTTTFEYVDPQRPEALVRFKRTTFLRHGYAEAEFPVQARLRVEDRPMSPQLAWLTASLGCVVGSVVGAAGGPVGAIAGCLVGGAGGGIAGAAAQDEEAPAEAAPSLRSSERVVPHASRFPVSQWQGFDAICGGRAAPDWCVP